MRKQRKTPASCTLSPWSLTRSNTVRDGMNSNTPSDASTMYLELPVSSRSVISGSAVTPMRSAAA